MRESCFLWSVEVLGRPHLRQRLVNCQESFWVMGSTRLWKIVRSSWGMWFRELGCQKHRASWGVRSSVRQKVGGCLWRHQVLVWAKVVVVAGARVVASAVVATHGASSRRRWDATCDKDPCYYHPTPHSAVMMASGIWLVWSAMTTSELYCLEILTIACGWDLLYVSCLGTLHTYSFITYLDTCLFY